MYRSRDIYVYFTLLRKKNMTIKTYRPIHVNMDSELVTKLDKYKSTSCPRSVLIHEAVKHYIFLLESRGVKKNS